MSLGLFLLAGGDPRWVPRVPKPILNFCDRNGFQHKQRFYNGRRPIGRDLTGNTMSSWRVTGRDAERVGRWLATCDRCGDIRSFSRRVACRSDATRCYRCRPAIGGDARFQSAQIVVGQAILPEHQYGQWRAIQFRREDRGWYCWGPQHICNQNREGAARC